MITQRMGRYAPARLVPVAASRALTGADFERELSLASGITITVPTDATLAISDPLFAPVVVFYCPGAVVPTFVTTGLTFNNAAPTFAQYGLYGIKRVGANRWMWL